LGGSAASPLMMTTRTSLFHFSRVLKEAGYVEGQNVAIEYRYAENQMDRLTSLVADLVRRRVAVIVASGSLATVAAKAVTTTASRPSGTGPPFIEGEKARIP
jgi:ABC-type uncharacterized transport system substrate-binding protein